MMKNKPVTPSQIVHSREFLERQICAASDWQWQTDSDLRFIAVTKGFHRVHNIEPDRVIGTNVLALKADCDDEKWAAFTQTLMAREAFQSIQCSINTDAGEQCIVLSGEPVFDGGGTFAGYRGLANLPTSNKSETSNNAVTSERFLRALDFFNGAIALFDDKDRKIAFNKTFRDIHDFLGDDLKIGVTFQDCVRMQIERGLIKDAIGNEEEFIAKRTERFRNPEGPFETRKPGDKWYRVTEQRLDDGGCLQTMEDISEMKLAELALRESEQRFKGFAETAADLFWETDSDYRINYLSERYEELTGDNPESILGLDFRQTHLTKDDNHARSQFDQAYGSTAAFDQIVVKYDKSDDNRRYFSLSGRPQFDSSSNFTGYRGVARDITEARRLTEQLNYHARYDSLTNLMNRREFNKQLSRVQNDTISSGAKAVLGFIDLDQFKIVNDAEGHPAGDRLLQEFAAFFKSKLREGDIFARLGGDEFGLIIEACALDEGATVVKQLLKSMNNFRFINDNRVYGVTASVGLAEISANSTSMEDLMRQVDIACYAAKDLGRNQLHIYGRGDEETTKRSQEVLHAAGIQQAIRNNRFVLYAQPIVKAHSADRTIEHYEVLLRMLDEHDNELSPASFIPVAERYRLMIEIDRWVIHNTLDMLKLAPSEFDRIQITINLSGGSLTDINLVDFIESEIRASTVAADRIIFEITETAVVASVEMACEFIDRLTAIGCRFAIDDFGSGMSSFAYLKKFQADFLKIDGSLILEIASESDDRTMVAAINQMAHVLGMKTIAEFVESEQIAEILDSIGVDLLQGYGVGKPTPLTDILFKKTNRKLVA